MMAEQPWRSSLPPDTLVASVFTPEQRANMEAVEAELLRKAENERFRIWEDGFMAGLVRVNGEHRKNPYQFHSAPMTVERAYP